MEENVKEKRNIISSALKGIKLKDAGMKIPKSKNGDLCCGPVSDNGVSYPSLYLNVKQAPDLLGYDVGDKVTLLIEGDITSHSADKTRNMDKETFDVQIKKIGCKK